MAARVPILIAQSLEAKQQPARREALMPWLGPLGVAFLAVGSIDIALTWYPMKIGSPAWELGTIMQSLNGLPVFALGFVLVDAWAAAKAPRWLAVTLSLVTLLMALAVVGMAVLLALSVPVALHAVQSPMIALGLKKATLKAAVQVVAFATLFTWLGTRGLRKAPTSAGKAE